MTREHWIEIYQYPRYFASNFGNIYDRFSRRLLTQTPDRAGYLRVKINGPVGRMTVSVHRLVAEAFYDVDLSEYEVNHKDGNKTNNYIGNLEVCTRSENMIHAFNSGLAKSTYPVQAIKIVETGEMFAPAGEVDRYLGVSLGSVSKTLRGLQKTCKGYTFEKIEGGGARAHR